MGGLADARADKTATFTLEAAIQQAIAKNPELEAARAKIAVAEARAKWAGKLADPNFELSAKSDEFGLDDDENTVQIAVSQKFPLTRRLAREKDVSQWDVALARAEVRVREWRLEGEVHEAVLAILALQRRVELRRRIRAVLADAVSRMEEAFQNAEMSQLDVTEARLELQTQVQALQKLEADLANDLGKLRGWLGLPAESRLSIAGRLGAPDEGPGHIEMSGRVLTRRPDLQLRLLRENRAEAALELAKSRRWQDVAVRLFVERENAVDEPDGLERNTFAGIGFSLPLPLRTSKARVSDVPSLEVSAARLSTAALVAAIRNEVAAANEEVARLRVVWQRANAEILHLARQNVREVEEAWEHGKITFARVQRAHERSLMLEESAIGALRDYHLARERLHHAAGLSHGGPTAPAKPSDP